MERKQRTRARSRSRSREGSPVMGQPQMFPICRSLQTLGRGASHKDNQQKFLSMMGILKTI